jgi:hypothetical protein
MARIVTDEPPSLRSVRPGLPRALDRVVLRGLERDRRRRYRDLEELRRALLPLLPARPTVGGLGLRFAAECIDLFVRFVLGILVGLVILHPLVLLGVLPELPLYQSMMTYGQPLGFLICIGYYGVCEGLWGCALGKWLLRLRVGTAASVEPPGFWRAALRAAIFYVVFQVSTLMNQLAPLVVDVPAPGVPPNEEQMIWLMLFFMASGGTFLIAVIVNFGTMRMHNGYRALHEFCSGTRTYRLRPLGPQQRRSLRQRTFAPDVTRPEGLPERVGTFKVRGALRWTDEERVLLAEDPHLDRAVWLWLRPASAPALTAESRDVSRTTRMRWVACGSDGSWQWDAFIAPAGIPLPVLAASAPRLSWADVRPMLEQQAEELEAACDEGSLPDSLTPGQVWVQPDGRVQLLTMPLGESSAAAGDEDERALRFLGEVAVTALEGAERPIDDDGDRVRAPLPPHASELLERLLNGRVGSMARLQQDLEAVRDRPAEVSRLRRAGHLALTAILMQVPVCGPAPMMLVWLAFFPLWLLYQQPNDNDAGVWIIVGYLGFCCTFWIAWAFAFRGGYLFWRGGVHLRRADGRKAARWQCALRAMVIWGPMRRFIAAPWRWHTSIRSWRGRISRCGRWGRCSCCCTWCWQSCGRRGRRRTGSRGRTWCLIDR